MAIVMVGIQLQPRDIVLHRRNDQLINDGGTHRCYDALQYPIIFWDGADGYNFNVKIVNTVNGAEIEKKMQCNELLRIPLNVIRRNGGNYIIKYRQLFHQYIVDMYVKIETNLAIS
ncbi:helitron_like_N domain-containing protein [Trichonephila clavipes]|nr:helitron_like_N domain-containing protein [Trichonephila clavipes]